MYYLIKKPDSCYQCMEVIPAIDGMTLRKGESAALPKRVIWEGRCYHKIGELTRSSGSSVVELVSRVAERIFGNFWKQKHVSQKENIEVYESDGDSLGKLQREIHELSANRAFPALIAPHPIARVEQLTNSGIALIVDYLRNKTANKNLFVCDTLEALQKGLKEIAKSTEDAKFSFIVSSHAFGICPNKRKPSEQHKMTVCVEKQNQYLHIIVVDPSPVVNIDPAHINFDRGLFGSKELVFSYLMELGLNPETTFFYWTRIARQFGPNGGCAVFALRDAVNFHKNPDFFRQMELEAEANLELPQGVIRCIRQLPPEYMKSIQSVSKLEAYMNSNKDRLDLESLLNSYQKHKVLLASEKERKVSFYCNRYIDDRVEKYHKILVGILRECSDAEINRRIKESLKK